MFVSRVVTMVVGIVLATVPTSPTIRAATARSWQLSNTDTFATGTLTGTEVDEEGRLRIAPRFRTLWGPAEGIVWAVAMADNGGAFVALSGPGRLVHVSASGAATTWYEDGEDGLVTAVVPDGSGGVYFGVSGSTGRVMQATAPETVRLIAETGSQFVWSLLREESGKLWAATGGPGKIMTRLPGERWETVFSSGDDPVRCLAALGDGNIVAGTGLEGRILRIGPDGRECPRAGPAATRDRWAPRGRAADRPREAPGRRPRQPGAPLPGSFRPGREPRPRSSASRHASPDRTKRRR